MDEKAKDIILDMLKSDDVREYFQQLFKEQTSELLLSLRKLEESEHAEEIQELKKQLCDEREINKSLSLKVQELECSYSRFSEFCEDKKRELNIISEQKRICENEAILLKNQNEHLKTKMSEAIIKCEEELQREKKENIKLTFKIDKYEKKYSWIESAYMNYQALHESVKQRLSNIFLRDDIYSFIVAMSDWNNIEGIWSFTKRRIIEDENKGVNGLVTLFSDAFTLFNIIEGNGRYKLINPKVGESFDSDIHSIKGIKTDGLVEEVLLCGIYDSIAKKPIFKAVIRIK